MGLKLKIQWKIFFVGFSKKPSALTINLLINNYYYGKTII